MRFFFIVYRQMRSVADKNCREHQNTHLMFSKNFSDNCFIYEMWLKYMVGSDRPQMTVYYGICTLRACK